MNFLAHSYLSGEFSDILIGNFIADSVKGNQAEDFPLEIQKGFQLHKKIDDYTDHHPIVKGLTEFLSPDFGHYASVVTDLYLDHFLAKKWDQYANIPLESFCKETYKTLLDRYLCYNTRFRQILPRLISENWLMKYRDLDEYDYIFKKMNDLRATFKSNMDQGIPILRKKYFEVEKAFDKYMPDVIKEIENYKKENNIKPSTFFNKNLNII